MIDWFCQRNSEFARGGTAAPDRGDLPMASPEMFA
jgi:hypothetical protein